MGQPLIMIKHEILQEIVFISRKYNLTDKREFVERIRKLNPKKNAKLEEIWVEFSKKVKNEDIIKDAKEISIEDKITSETRAEQTIKKPTNVLKLLLHLEFDQKKYDLRDENKIRHYRNKVAQYYLKTLYDSYEQSLKDSRALYLSTVKRKTFKIVSSIVIIGLILLSPLYYQYFKLQKEISQWRLNGIKNSPTVCITRTGTKYHNCYHYSTRNYQISLFEAVIDKEEEPCGTCNPPVIDFGKKPVSTLPNPYGITILFTIIGASVAIEKKRGIEEKCKIVYLQ